MRNSCKPWKRKRKRATFEATPSPAVAPDRGTSRGRRTALAAADRCGVTRLMSSRTKPARGCPCLRAGYGSERSQGWRSEADMQRAEARKAEANVKREDAGISEPIERVGQTRSSRGAQTNPMGPSSGDSRIARGSYFNYEGGFCRSSQRYEIQSPDFAGAMGFRVARNP